MKLEHNLLTTDFSKEARRAYAPVAELARRVGARITLLHVISYQTALPTDVLGAPAVLLSDPEQERKDALALLEQEAAQLGAGLELKLDALLAADVPQGVVEYASKHRAHLIALSTHGRTGFRRLVLGSVAEAILRHSRVPVLCFPASK